MTVSRRSVLKAGAVVPVAMSSVAQAAQARAPALVVADSRHPASRAFAARLSAPVIDVAREDARFWRSLREAVPLGQVAGLTRWSDFVIVRGALEERGKRVIGQRREGNLFRWDMA